MADPIANAVIGMPSQLFTLARSFKALANGKIYIGQIDTDPTIPSNQIQVYLENEDGTHVPVAQPIIINAGGYPVYNGQIAKFVTVQGHAMAVYDSYNAQQFYFPNVLKYDPDQFRQLLAGPDGVLYINGGDLSKGDVYVTPGDKINLATYFKRILYITDLQSLAVGTDWSAAFTFLNSNAPSNLEVVFPPGEYITTVGLKLSPGMRVTGKGGKITLKASAVNESGITMASGSSISGDLSINLENAAGANWRRAFVSIGEYDTGIGRSNVSISGLTFLGGHPDVNGVFVTGDSDCISISNINVPDNPYIGRVVLAHWGGINYHNRNPDGSETHVPGQYTTHPNSITIRNISTGALSYAYGTANRGNCAVVFFSAAYACSVENITTDRCQQVACLYGSDFGFTYATDAVKLLGQSAISVNNVRCNLADYRALTVNGLPNYTNDVIGCESTFDNWVVNGNRTDAFNSSGVVIGYANNLKATNFRLKSWAINGVLIQEGTSDVVIDNFFIDSTNNTSLSILGSIARRTARIRVNLTAVNANLSASTDPVIGSAIYTSGSVSDVRIEGSIGAVSSVNAYVHGVYINKSTDIRIKATIGEAAAGGFCLASNNGSYSDRLVNDDCTLIKRGSVGQPGLSFHVFMSFNGNGNAIIYGSAPPTGGSWVNEDRMVQTSALVGRSVGWTYHDGVWLSQGYYPPAT